MYGFLWYFVFCLLNFLKFIFVKKSLKEHIDLIRHKDELIIQLRSANCQLSADLDKANEILLESENRIEQLQNEFVIVDNRTHHLENLLLQESKKNQV